MQTGTRSSRAASAAAWHARSSAEVLEAWGTDPERGLDEAEAAARLRRFGPNKLPDEAPPSWWRIFLAQFQDFMVLLLVAATGVSLLMGETADAVVILAIVLLNAVLGTFQEARAERSLSLLKALTAPQVRLLRQGREATVAAEEVVPGDLLLLEAGDRVGADARLLRTAALEADESALTGESQPAAKRADAELPEATPLGERSNMVYQGTVITRGRGRAVVVATGLATEIGAIAGLIHQSEEVRTPLEERLERLGRWIVAACLAIAGATTLIGIARGYAPYEMFLAGVGLAVAAIPEGLPAVVTITLALGVQRMIRHNAIVRHLPAVETLGTATVIASDKTGTLTRNEMSVREVRWPGGRCLVDGVGYDPSPSAARLDLEGSGGEPALRRLALAALLASDARLERREERWTVAGDPTEGALVALAGRVGLPPEESRAAWPRLAELPFEAERRAMSVLVRAEGRESAALWPAPAGSPQAGAVLLVKGAPDRILDSSRYLLEGGRCRPLTAEARRRLAAGAEEMAARALRVLAVGYRPARPAREIGAEEEEGLVFLGLVGMIDPPRPETAGAVAECKAAGIGVAMITGDHPATALAVAREVGIAHGPEEVLLGQELERLEDRELERRLRVVRVFARVSPAHKLRVVRAFQRLGAIVAMTGDGVNDAPAVKQADIGVAMGRSGTEVTREAADLILTDDNFATIVAAVREGRTIYDNVRRSIRYLLACNTGELLAMFGGIVLGLPLPLTAAQILFVNLVTDGLPAVALSLEPPEEDVMRRPPRPPRESLFARGLGRRVLERGLFIGLATLAVFSSAWWGSRDLALARTLATATLVLTQLIHALEVRSEERPFWELGWSGNPLLLAAVASSLGALLLILYLPWAARAFEVVAPPPAGWLPVALAGLVALLLVFLDHLGRRGRPGRGGARPFARRAVIR
ncbi:MAG: cation-translocating P-type ATPase [Bacillota bacterium]|nr:cation-translocating P-type ATPase [Bacillota bacterium]